MAKVWLKNQNVLKYLKHPVSKTGFRDANAYAIWPDDSFTARRIRDGDVTIEDPGTGGEGARKREELRKSRQEHKPADEHHKPEHEQSEHEQPEHEEHI
jgi:hypothetical protein